MIPVEQKGLHGLFTGGEHPHKEQSALGMGRQRPATVSLGPHTNSPLTSTAYKLSAHPATRASHSQGHHWVSKSKGWRDRCSAISSLINNPPSAWSCLGYSRAGGSQGRTGQGLPSWAQPLSVCHCSLTSTSILTELNPLKQEPVKPSHSSSFIDC